MAEHNFKELLDQSWQLRREKRFPEAELLLHEALDQHAPGSFEHSTLKANLADVLLRQGNTAGARETALEVLDKEPAQVTALTVLGLAALENKSAAEAVENLQKAYNYAPNPFRAGRLARALEMEGRTHEALNFLREALQSYPDDNYLLKQYSALQNKAENNHPDSGQKQVLPSEILSKEIKEEDFLPYAEQMKAKLGHLEPEEAAAQLQKIIKVGKRKENPHLHLLLGDLWRKAGNEGAAAEAYWKARELDPENLLALSQLLYTYRRLGRKDEAWPLLKLLLYYQPTDKTAKSSLLKDAADLGKEEETALFFEELLQKYPQRKEFYGAIRKLKKAAEIKADNSQEEH